MRRSILHVDFNNFYASVECLYNPEIRDKPVVVGGDMEARHGIVLAKNMLAKKYGIQTGDVLWQARQKCPNVVVVPPNYKRYIRFSKLAKQIYSEYTSHIESFGLDECWLDITGTEQLFGSADQLADELRERVRFELGVTVSVGVSWNKIFAKLGSDIKKPDATTVITQSNYKEVVWNLSVSDLLFVGRATDRRLNGYGIHTIGQLANTDPKLLQSWFGVNGLMLHRFANGLDNSPVMESGESAPIKTIGNSTTTPRDLVSDRDVKLTFYMLAESVAARLREAGVKSRTLQIHVRDSNLISYERQMKFPFPLCTAVDLAETAMVLYKAHHDGRAIRSLGLRACDLIIDEYHQCGLLPDMIKNEKEQRLEETIDRLRTRFGHFSIERGLMFVDRDLTGINPKDEHTIHPVGWR